MNELKKEFFLSQIKIIRDIKETEKTKLSLIFYERTQSTCILRICKNRDLSEVCKRHMEITHPNIVVVYDYIYIEGDTYIVEEYISGRSLEEIISEDGVISEDDTVKIITKVCDGLEQLHFLEPPLVHNDIKTSNIMIKDDGSVKLFDFDISRLYRNGASKNTELFGTEEYAAPEHFGYGQSEPRTDIYSIGVTMHRMLTGKSLDNEHKSIYDGPLKNIINKCIQISPEKRYATVLLLKKDLKKYREKAAKPIMNILLAIIASIGLIGVMAVSCNMFNSGAKNGFENISDGYAGDISNENQENTGEIENTIGAIAGVEGIIDGTRENVLGDVLKDTTEDITDDAIKDTIENISGDISKDTIDNILDGTTEDFAGDMLDVTINDTIEDILENTADGTTKDVTQAISNDTTKKPTVDMTQETTTTIKEEISSHIHRYVQKVVDATCEEKGYMEYTCSCGEQYINEIAAKGHSYYEQTIYATCTEKGYKKYTCACGKSYTDNSTEKLGHLWSDATCEEAKKCRRCNIEEGKPLGHKYVKCECTECGDWDNEGYMKATDPALNLKNGKWYSKIRDIDNDTLLMIEFFFETGSNRVQRRIGYYKKEPLEDAKGEYIQPYVYKGETYYKQSEATYYECEYEIVGRYVRIDAEDGVLEGDYLLTIDGEGLISWDDIDWFTRNEGQYFFYHDTAECSVKYGCIYQIGFGLESGE